MKLLPIEVSKGEGSGADVAEELGATCIAVVDDAVSVGTVVAGPVVVSEAEDGEDEEEEEEEEEGEVDVVDELPPKGESSSWRG